MGNSSSKSKGSQPGASSGLAKFKKGLGGNKSGGQTLGSTPTPGTQDAPKTPAPPPTTGGKTLGGTSPPGPDARLSAARAAEERANKAAGKGGKLQSQLAAQKKQTRTQTLGDASKQNQRARDADEAVEARNWQ